MTKHLLISSIIFCLLLLFFAVGATGQTNQVVVNGASTTAVNFGGAGCVYKWTNDNPAIGLPASGTGDIPFFTAVNNGTLPVTATITAVPQAAGFAYIVNQKDGTVSVINTATNTVTTTIDLGMGPGAQGVVFTPIRTSSDGRLIYLSFQGQNSSNVLIVIDAAMKKVVQSIPVDEIISDLVLSSDNSKIYVGSPTAFFQGIVKVYDSNTFNLISQFNTVGQPNHLALSPDDKLLCFDDQAFGNLTMVNTVTNQVTGSIANLVNPFGMVFSPDGKYLYVCDQHFNTVTVYNTLTNTLVATIAVGDMPRGIVVSPDGKYLYVTSNTNGGEVYVINTSNNSVVTNISAGPLYGISITPDGNSVYLAEGNADSTAVINTVTNKVIKTIAVGLNADSYGDFVTAGIGCSNKPITFTITVNPTLPPVITTSIITGTISSCQGTASSSPNIQEFAITASNLTAGINAISPAGFEISTDPSIGYATLLTLTQTAGMLSNTIIYVRSSSTAPAGNLLGNVLLTSTGAASQNVAVSGTVNALPTVNPVPNQTVINGAATTAVKFTGTASGYTWVNDTPGIGLPASGTGNIASFTATNNGSSLVTATITATPLSSAYAYIANSDAGTISVISTSTLLSIATIPVGIRPFGVATAKDGSRVYITNSGSNTVSVINTSSNTVIATIPVGVYPQSVVVSPDGTRLYIGYGEDDNFISIINTSTNTLIDNIKTDLYVYGLAISSDGSKLYYTNETNNSVIIVNTKNYSVKNSISLNQTPFTLALSPDGTRIYVTTTNSLIVIDATNSTIISTVPVGLNPSAVCLSPDGNTIYISNLESNTVSVVNAINFSIISTIKVGFNPFGISISQDGNQVFVVNNNTNNVSLINTSTNSVIATIPVGTSPEAYGNFIKPGTGCIGTPTQFTITVNPSPPPAVNFDAATLASLSTTYGTPSTSASFKVSATNLKAGVLVTPPQGFEVSTNNSTFSSTVSIGTTGSLASTTVYIRLAAVTAVGLYAGNINLSSTGASDTNFGMANSEVDPALLTVTASNADKVYGTTLTGGSSSVVFSTTGLQNSEIISSVAVTYGTGAAATDPVDTYTGSVVIANANGGTFNPVNYTINYVSGDIIIKPAPLIATVDNKSKVFGAVNPVFTITYSGFVNSDNASVITADPVINTTALTNSPAGQYPVTAVGAAAQNYTFTYLPGVLTITPLAQAVVIPNAFTPNGDGINDFWNIKYLNFYPKCTVNVYTRYGEKVYSSVGYANAWDGTYKGARLPTGTYYYVIDPQSGLKILSGYITIIR